MATKTSTKKTSAKKSVASKKKLVSIPQIYMDATKSLSAATSQIDIFGEDGELITIKQTIGPWDIITLSNFCISYSSYKSGDTEIYDDRFFEYGYPFIISEKYCGSSKIVISFIVSIIHCKLVYF